MQKVAWGYRVSQTPHAQGACGAAGLGGACGSGALLTPSSEEEAAQPAGAVSSDGGVGLACPAELQARISHSDLFLVPGRAQEMLN